MTIGDLHALYIDQLQDLHSACNQSLHITTKLGRAASNKHLSEALIARTNGISVGMDALNSLCAAQKVDPNGEPCEGMQSLVAEAQAHALNTDFAEADERDATIITQYNRVEHHAIAGYGCLVAMANRSKLYKDAAVLKQHLDANYDGDRRMTDIATDDGANQAAV